MNPSVRNNGATKSLDQIDRESFGARTSPMATASEKVELQPGPAGQVGGPFKLELNGDWQLAEEGDEAERLVGEWQDAIPAPVPGSVHTALWRAGRIPNPYIGQNDAFAREKSFKTWWYKRTFECPPDLQKGRLCFDGIAVRCTIWLNGVQLGQHEGMFGGPEFEVSKYLKAENTLIVKIDPAPYKIGPEPLNDFFTNMNVGWTTTVVFNNVYGWHYSNIPALGIWRAIRIESEPEVALVHPFIAARDAQAGLVDLSVELHGKKNGWAGKLVGSIEPDNFPGDSYHFERKIQSTEELAIRHLDLAIPNPQLWWPNGYGEQNLYRLRLSFIPNEGAASDEEVIVFGLRTVAMAPLPGGPYPEKYNWTFVINDQPMFIKGTGWCTMDPLMDFTRPRYERLISLAKDQHVMMLRCWGSGMPETDEFYDLCDRYGILVLQEWPTAWNSHENQPYEILEETVRLNTLRLRNHPALVMWGGGNESSQPFGKAIDMMGRLSIELDGTRAFHRGEPWGGSLHDYSSDWGRQPLDVNLHLRADFFGEFGMNSVPVYESVQRYLPPEERDVWPPPDGKSFTYHTPVFNTKGCMDRLRQFSGYFSAGDTLAGFIFGSQLAAATCTRHTLELARTRWPACSGALYYKMNDNYPAASWACVDWFGAPKLTHFFNMDAFEPLAAVVLFDSFKCQGKPLDLPVWLLDDRGELVSGNWEVNVRVYKAALEPVAWQAFAGSKVEEPVTYLGCLRLTSAQTDSTPLLVTSEVVRQGQLAFRTFYWLNFEGHPDCLLNLPPTRLKARICGSETVEVSNIDNLPAVGVNLQQPGSADTFRAHDNYFWLNPGERRILQVSSTTGLIASAWNAGQVIPE